MTTPITTRTLSYAAPDGTLLHSYLALPAPSSSPVAGIVIAPEWWGVTPYPQHRAEQLAALGYAALAIDLYGDGKTTDQASQANQWMTEMLANPTGLMQRAQAGLEQLAAQPEVDSTRLAAMGYCFGGKVALDMARDGMAIQAVASFHGNLSPKQPAEAATFKAAVLIETGAADPLVTADAVAQFEAEMQAAGVSYTVHQHAGAKHGFTNPNVDALAAKNGVDFLAYHAEADHQSWQHLLTFLAQHLA
jgi:dienelactone hydrolase